MDLIHDLFPRDRVSPDGYEDHLDYLVPVLPENAVGDDGDAGGASASAEHEEDWTRYIYFVNKNTGQVWSLTGATAEKKVRGMAPITGT